MIGIVTIFLNILNPTPQPPVFIDYSKTRTEIVQMKPGSRQEVVDYLIKNGEGNNVEKWLCIMDKESNFCYYDYGIANPYATGCTQIIPSTWEYAKCEGNPLIWTDNLQCAFRIRDLQGWSAWAVNNKCNF